MKKNELKKSYFKLYEKYLKLIPENQTTKLEFDASSETIEFIEKLQNEYGVSMDSVVGATLQLCIDEKKGIFQ